MYYPCCRERESFLLKGKEGKQMQLDTAQLLTGMHVVL
jgi:hypothetical protein